MGELHLTRSLPPPAYSEAQWEAVEALTGLLPVAVAQLELLFRERGQVDFTAMAQAAVRALGPEDEPTDLALALDYRVRHLLVDEFQDTSQSQYELLTRLTSGMAARRWPHAVRRGRSDAIDLPVPRSRGRTIPARAPRRHRRGEAGAADAQAVNFRSQAGVVAWVNRTFRALLPKQEDLGSGAVPFSASEEGAAGTAGPGGDVCIRC